MRRLNRAAAELLVGAGRRDPRRHRRHRLRAGRTRLGDGRAVGRPAGGGHRPRCRCTRARSRPQRPAPAPAVTLATGTTSPAGSHRPRCRRRARPAGPRPADVRRAAGRDRPVRGQPRPLTAGFAVIGRRRGRRARPSSCADRRAQRSSAAAIIRRHGEHRGQAWTSTLRPLGPTPSGRRRSLDADGARPSVATDRPGGADRQDRSGRLCTRGSSRLTRWTGSSRPIRWTGSIRPSRCSAAIPRSAMHNSEPSDRIDSLLSLDSQRALGVDRRKTAGPQPRTWSRRLTKYTGSGSRAGRSASDHRRSVGGPPARSRGVRISRVRVAADKVGRRGRARRPAAPFGAEALVAGADGRAGAVG